MGVTDEIVADLYLRWPSTLQLFDQLLPSLNFRPRILFAATYYATLRYPSQAHAKAYIFLTEGGAVRVASPYLAL
jgi:hypothetical protein